MRLGRTSFLALPLLILVLGACSLPAIGFPPKGMLPAVTPQSGSTLFSDDFSSPISGWDRMKSAEGIIDYFGGGYRMLVNALQTDFWSTPHKDFADVRIEVDAGKLGGPDENRIGLICRKTGSDYYFFIMSSDGYYGIGVFKNGQAVLIGQSLMQSSNRIITGTNINHLRADCNGDALTFYVNGFQIAQVHDPGLTHGDIGLLAGTFTQPGVDIVFEHFVVLKP
jgi:hypothetical protein